VVFAQSAGLGGIVVRQHAPGLGAAHGGLGVVQGDKAIQKIQHDAVLQLAAAKVGHAVVHAAKAAADAATSYVNHASGMGDVVAAAAHAATGGMIDPFIFRLAIFVLAIFVGYYVVWSVTPALHTPLMAVTNAVSAIVIVGAMLAAALTETTLGKSMGVLAVALAAVNVFGGFLVTRRMLEMFKKKDKKPAAAKGDAA
jgi:NAD(P) transhydrogenase subunit alpha